MAGYIGSKAVNLSTTGADINGDANIDGDLSFRDNDKAIFGAGSDLQIYHDSAQSSNLITSLNSTNTTIQSGGIVSVSTSQSNLLLNGAVATLTGNDEVSLSGATVTTTTGTSGVVLDNNGSTKLATISSGVSITGSLGIGTSTPRTGLHLYGAGQTTSAISDAGSLGAFLRVSDTGAAGGAGGGVVFGTNASEADGFAGFAAIKGLLSNGNDRTIGALAFSTRASTTDTALTERMRLTSDGNVGIGRTPRTRLEIASGNSGGDAGLDAPVFRITNTTLASDWDSGDVNGKIEFYSDDASGNAPYDTAFIQSEVDFNNGTLPSGALVFGTATYNAVGGAVERMRIDSSGNLLVGTTNTNIVASSTATDEGFVYVKGSALTAARSAGHVADFNRITNDGEIIRLRKNGYTVGYIGNISTHVYIGGPSSSGFYFGGSRVQPISNGSLADNLIDVGHPSYRFQDIYAVNDAINTSDRNEKQDIAELSDAEQRVAVAAKGLMRKFRWKNRVAEKGDDARIHCGIIAQDLQAAFAAEGLDAGDYAMFISSTWWEHDVEVPAVEAVAEVTETTTDEDGNEVITVVTEAVEAVDAYTRTDTYDTQEEAPEGATERTRLGVRYSELLAFIIGAL